MKDEIVAQNAISAQSLLIANIPSIDIYIEKDGESEDTWNTYITYIENKGNGTATNIDIHKQLYESRTKHRRAKSSKYEDLKS